MLVLPPRILFAARHTHMYYCHIIKDGLHRSQQIDDRRFPSLHVSSHELRIRARGSSLLSPKANSTPPAPSNIPFERRCDTSTSPLCTKTPAHRIIYDARCPKSTVCRSTLPGAPPPKPSHPARGRTAADVTGLRTSRMGRRTQRTRLRTQRRSSPKAHRR